MYCVLLEKPDNNYTWDPIEGEAFCLLDDDEDEDEPEDDDVKEEN